MREPCRYGKGKALSIISQRLGCTVYFMAEPQRTAASRTA